MLPEEEIASGSFGFWWPVILHIIEQFHFFLEYGAVKSAKGSSGGCIRPYPMNGKALTESLNGYLSQSIT